MIIADHKDVVVISQPAKIVVPAIGGRGPQGAKGDFGGPPGPPGPQGIQGPAGVSSVLEVPAIDITSALGENRVITIENGTIAYATTQSTGEILGFTKFAVTANSAATIQNSGELNGFSGLTTGLPIFLADNGVISQTIPITGRLQCLGVALSATKILIQIQPPLFLSSNYQFPFSVTLSKLQSFATNLIATHEGGLEDTELSHDWSTHGRVAQYRSANRAGANKIVGWGQILWSASASAVTPSDKIMLKNFLTFMIITSNLGVDEWWLVGLGAVSGAFYNATDMITGQIGASEMASGIQTTSAGVTTARFDHHKGYHFWTTTWGVTIPNGTIKGVLTLSEAKATANDGSTSITPNTFLYGTSADYYTDSTYKGDEAIGKHRFLTSDYEWYGMSTATESELSNLYTHGYLIAPQVQSLIDSGTPLIV